MSLPLSRNSLNLPRIINDPLPLEPPSPPLSLFLDFRYPSPLLEWLNRACRVQNSSRVSDRESVEPRRFFGVLHADRKSTTMVSFHFQNVVRERKKLVGHRFSLFLSLSLVDTTKEFHGLVAVEINELYLVVAQIFNQSIDTYRFLWPWIIYIYI